MNKQFKQWLLDDIIPHFTEGNNTSKSHLLRNFQARQGAELAWEARQPEIDALKAKIKN